MNSLALYFRYIGISIRGQMQYKASFLMLVMSTAIIGTFEFAGVWALFDRFHNLRGWSFPEAALLFGMVNVAYSITEAAARGFDIFSLMIKNGDFDRILLRPRSTVLQILGQELQLMRIGRLLQSVVVLIWAVWVLGIVWTPAKIALLLTSIISGVLFFTALFIFQATMAFWTVESLEIINTLTYGGVETTQYPMSIYHTWFRRLFTMVIPLAFVNYIPALAILGRHESSGIPPILHWLSPAVGLAILLISLQAWKVGVRHYTSTGS